MTKDRHHVNPSFSIIEVAYFPMPHSEEASSRLLLGDGSYSDW
jgi:hypothetical protein